MSRIKFNIVAGEYVEAMSSDFNHQFADASEQMAAEHKEKQSSAVRKAFAYIKRPVQILSNCVFNRNKPQ